jgi:DNA-binding NarL/FixJ family response regulator
MCSAVLRGGGTRRDIARELSVSEGAIKAHIKSLLYKTRAKSNPHLAMTSQEQVRPLETMKAL